MTRQRLGDPVLLEKIDLPQLVVVGVNPVERALSSKASPSFPSQETVGFVRDSQPKSSFADPMQAPTGPSPPHWFLLMTDPEHTARLRSWKTAKMEALDAESFPATMQEVRLRICGPEKDHLSVIDVPGIFKNTTTGLTTKEDIELVRDMVFGYMKNPRSIMLTVIPANVDIATQEILEMARESEKKVIDSIEGRASVLKLGWGVVRNPGQQQLLDQKEDPDFAKVKFFRDNSPWDSLDKHKTGISSLRSRLQAVQMFWGDSDMEDGKNPFAKKEGDPDRLPVRKTNTALGCDAMLEGILHDQETLPRPSDDDILIWIEKLYHAPRQSARWSDLALGYVSDVIAIIHNFIVKVLQATCPDEQIRLGLWAAVTDDLSQRYRDAMAHANFILNGNIKQTVRYIHDILKAYYEVASKRIVDNVCMQATICHRVEAQLMEIAREDVGLNRRRKQLRREMEELEAGRKILLIATRPEPTIDFVSPNSHPDIPEQSQRPRRLDLPSTSPVPSSKSEFSYHPALPSRSTEILRVSPSEHMSRLWQSFIQDDVEGFRQFLANATFAGPRTTASSGTGATANLSKMASPGAMIASSPNPPKSKKSAPSPGSSAPERPGFPRSNTTLSRADVNARDHYGRTLLHHVASSPKPTATHFALALLEIPFLDIYAQDWESGWTALHRALYAGNATIAQALLARDMHDATDFNKLGNVNHPSGNLIKIKDREGYSPFDVYGATITSRDIKQVTAKLPGFLTADNIGSDTASNTASNYGDGYEDEVYVSRSALKPRMDLSADEVFTLGSNKNLSLGLGDQDDRQYPERVALKRPEHLLQRFYREYQEHMERLGLEDTLGHVNSKDLPTLIQNRHLKFQDIVMSKLHTAILTTDPEANLFMSGFGPGGRLGTGDESTRFSFVCIETGGLAGKKVVSVALGQDHSLAITEYGEIFSWGSNKFGQLGYSLPRTSNRNDVPIQTTPRQIFNPFKKETLLGAAASAIHSVVFNTSGLYTFGKNEGQLGLMDSDARSLEVQVTPRRVGASLFNCPIQMVSAIDRATAILLQNNEVWVFSQYGYSKVSFPLEVSSRFIRDSFMTTRYDASVNHVVKLASGGSTICALASSGDVFTVQANKPENSSALASTTNPAKIRNSLAAPVRAWSVKKSHMAASDVDVGQDGSIIICTTSGSAWRKEKRVKNKEGASKEYKFARIPGLSSAVAVRSNAFGAYAVAQRDCDVTREQVHVEQSTLWDDLLPLSPFTTPGPEDIESILDGNTASDPIALSSTLSIKRAILSAANIEDQFLSLRSGGTVWATSSLSDARIPVHEFLLMGRSPVLKDLLQEFRQSCYASIPDVLDIEYGKDGHTQIRLHGVDFVTVLNLVFFLYTDSILDVWHQVRSSPQNTTRFRQVRTEVMRVATQLGLPTLERAARLMVEPQPSLKTDLARAINQPSFFDNADVVVQLNGESIKVHSQVICQRCPFFDALFHGRSGGKWLAMRRINPGESVHVDLKHVDRSTFDFVLRYLYADMEEHLFDEVRTKDLDDFVDLLLDVMFVANELMIDRLSQVCQKMLGRFDLDEDILRELDAVCHENQLSCFPISRGRNSEDYIFEKYPEIVSSVETDRQRRIDAMTLQTRVNQVESYNVRPRAAPSEKAIASPTARKGKGIASRDVSNAALSPVLRPRKSTSDLMFQMDEEPALSIVDSMKGKSAMRSPRPGEGMRENRSYPDSPALTGSIPEAESLGDGGFLDEQMSLPQETLLAESPSESRAMTLNQKRALASPPGPSPAPWSSPAISNSKKDLKDIMGETSQSRVSNLTLGMADRRESSGSFASKPSQKERKKMQQQQMQEMLDAKQQAKEVPRNPWQIPAPASSATPGKLDPLPGQSGPSTPTSEPAKAVQKPAMTLRQTVAGTPPRSKPVATPQQTQKRSVSGNIKQSPSLSKTPTSGPSTPPQPTQPSTSPQPAIQSIRHIPRPDPNAPGSRSPSHSSLSLATILHQQQSEKDEIREAATAKHNLQDIQAEQEFQQWWDQESKRVQGLIEPDSDQQPRGGKSGRGGKAPGAAGSSRKRRGNKKPAPTAADDSFTSKAHKSLSGPAPGHSTPKKDTNGHAPVQTQRTSSGNHASGSSHNARRGGHGNQRGKGRDRG
ncbi:hypothetical protein NUU61_009850 [Penicillium alfredii]|uniref:BTB domain-containing protein n=1 Tax=Penicillium alfredii TaxID=1506179 RepID=A0A9W9JU32_9EURO|nr:uncharacterized protein NUU61_009850 [Penicillium alfredii]KAJ5081586.1 hypothetical protein NUU61_009850 [Penicillium alfredii]